MACCWSTPEILYHLLKEFVFGKQFLKMRVCIPRVSYPYLRPLDSGPPSTPLGKTVRPGLPKPYAMYDSQLCKSNSLALQGTSPQGAAENTPGLSPRRE